MEEDAMEYRMDEPLADDFDMANQNLMDEDGIEEKAPAPEIVQVTSTRLDLDNFAQNYTDYGLLQRLSFIADVCPPLQYEALAMLVNYVHKNTQNVAMYVMAYQKFEKVKQNYGNNMLSPEVMPPMDTIWIDNTTSKSQSRLETLLAESKRQKDEGVKESIRRSMEEVFFHHVQMGNLSEALKLYGRGMREYCTAPNYMLISWINVTIYADQWTKLDILLPQVERAIAEAQERENVAATSTSRHSVAALPAKINATKTYKELIQSSKAKVYAVTGLYRMHKRNYKNAADSFIQVDLDALNYPQLLSSNDVAVYGTLCSLATYDRTELKDKVLGSTLFRKFLESEPKLVELLHKFCKSAFGTCLDILEELRDQLFLNMYLAPHLEELYSLIRRRAIIQYCSPYVTTDIRQMAAVFRTSSEELEEELVKLIELGSLSARIDSFNKILHSRTTDQRVEIYKKVMALRQTLDERVRGILLRAACQQNKIVVGHGDPIGKGQGRRRPATHNLDDSDESTPHDVYMERETSPNVGNSSSTQSERNPSGSSRFMANMKSLFRSIHPSSSSNASSSATNSVGPATTSGDVPPAPWSEGATLRGNEADSSSNSSAATLPLSVAADRGSVPPAPGGGNGPLSPSDAEVLDLSDDHMSDL